jgi:hypothetical protein
MLTQHSANQHSAFRCSPPHYAPTNWPFIASRPPILVSIIPIGTLCGATTTIMITPTSINNLTTFSYSNLSSAFFAPRLKPCVSSIAAQIYGMRLLQRFFPTRHCGQEGNGDKKGSNLKQQAISHRNATFVHPRKDQCRNPSNNDGAKAEKARHLCCSLLLAAREPKRMPSGLNNTTPIPGSKRET